MTPEEFISYLKDQASVYGSQKAFARHCGVSESFLSDVLRGRREPGATLLECLGFQKVVTYERIAERGMED